MADLHTVVIPAGMYMIAAAGHTEVRRESSIRRKGAVYLVASIAVIFRVRW